MQRRIDQGAISFSKSLYSSLVQGDPIDAAVTLARKAVSPDCLASLEWSVPLLFLRVSDGRLFRAAGEEQPQPQKTERSPAPVTGGHHYQTIVENMIFENGDGYFGPVNKS